MQFIGGTIALDLEDILILKESSRVCYMLCNGVL